MPSSWSQILQGARHERGGERRREEEERGERRCRPHGVKHYREQDMREEDRGGERRSREERGGSVLMESNNEQAEELECRKEDR